MEHATLLDSDLQLPTQSSETELPEDPYSGLRKLAESARSILSQPPKRSTNNFDRHIEAHGQQPPQWHDWLRAI